MIEYPKKRFSGVSVLSLLARGSFLVILLSCFYFYRVEIDVTAISPKPLATQSVTPIGQVGRPQSLTKGIDAYSELAGRPVFSQARRPFTQPKSVEVTEVPVPQPTDEGFELLGVLLWRDTKQALIKTPAFPEGQWLSEGSDLTGWRLEAIRDGQATLKKDGARRTLHLLNRVNDEN